MLLPYGGEDCVILCAIHKHIIGATFESSTIVNYGYLINAYRYTLRRKGGKNRDCYLYNPVATSPIVQVQRERYLAYCIFLVFTH